MGVASPFQSEKPLENWLDGLLTKELVQLWEFLSRNLDSHMPACGCNAAHDQWADDLYSQYHKDTENPPTPSEVRTHLYSESLPSNFYACKDRGGLRPSEPRKGAMGVGLYKHRRTRDPLNK